MIAKAAMQTQKSSQAQAYGNVRGYGFKMKDMELTIVQKRVTILSFHLIILLPLLLFFIFAF